MGRQASPAGSEDTSADPRSALSVRRALLPWRRRVTNINDFDFTPQWARRADGDIFNPLPLLALPLSLLAFVVLLVAAVEFLLALPLTPFALLRRRMRKAWPVEILDRRGRLLERTEHPTWQAAGDFAEDLRFERNLEQWV